MLLYKWLKSHKKEIRILLIVTLLLTVCLLILSLRQNRFFVKEGNAVVAIERETLEEAVSLPMKVEIEKDGERYTYQVILSLQETGGTASVNKTADATKASQEELWKDDVVSLVQSIQGQDELRISLPDSLEDGSSLRWKTQKDYGFLLIWLLVPACLFYIYETERQQETARRRRYEEEIRRALPGFLDHLLLLLNCGMIFHDAFYRIAWGQTESRKTDAFSELLEKIKKETDETGYMVVTVMKNLSQQVGIREYVRLVNILMDHQHRGVNLEEKLQGESRLLWEGRKAAAMQKGKEMETKMTFPLALLLVALMMIAGVPALMNL